MRQLLAILTLPALPLSVRSISTDREGSPSLSHKQLVEIKHDIIYGIRQTDSLVNAGKPDKALSFYKKSLKAKDSLYNLLTTSQMEEILVSYDIDKLILRKEQRYSMFHYICLTVSIIIIVALLPFNIHIYRSRKHLQKDEKEMRRLTAIAKEANEIKSRFLANMSYNIHIPLNNVVGFSQLTTDDAGLSEEEKREYSDIIQNNVVELIQLVNNMLDLSCLEANMMKFQLQDCNVQEWCSELACPTQIRSEGSIYLELEADAGDATIHTDVNRFTQVVSNMSLYPIECKKRRDVKMKLAYNAEAQNVSCQIANSPLADPTFSSQKQFILQKTCHLFFEHFNDTFRIEESNERGSVIYFIYPIK